MTALSIDDEAFEQSSARCAAGCGRKLIVGPPALRGRRTGTYAFSEDVVNNRRVFYCRPCTEEQYRRGT